jgi:hypothetical protein
MTNAVESSMTPSQLSAQHFARRITAVVGLTAIALIHLLDLPDKLEEAPLVGAGFVGLIVGCLVLAEGLLRSDDARLWVASGALAAATMLGYALSRTIGLPTEHGSDVGNWTEPIGLASLLVEGIVVWLAVARLTSVTSREAT